MKAILRLALLIAIAGLLPVSSRAEGVVIQWERIYNGPGNGHDSPTAVAVDTAGNAIVTGETRSGSNGSKDIYTAKYAAADGALLWERLNSGPAGMGAYSTSLALDSAGNVVITGMTETPAQGLDAYTAKYAASDGSLMWEQSHSGGSINQVDRANYVSLDSADNVIVSGYVTALRLGGVARRDAYIAKYAATDGAVHWQKTYNATSNARAHDIFGKAVTDRADNVIVAAATLGGDNDTLTSVVKYAGDSGEVVWSAIHLEGTDFIFTSDLAVDGADNIIFTSIFQHLNPLARRFRTTAKYAATNGARLWNKQYIGSINADHRMSSVRVDDKGKVIVTGLDVDINVGDSGNRHIYRVNYDAVDGEFISEDRSPIAANVVRNYNFGLMVDPDGNTIVTGAIGSEPNFDIFTAKYGSEDLTLLWQMEYNGVGNSMDLGRAAVLDAAGNVIVIGDLNFLGIGNILGVGNSTDYYTAKYIPVDLDADRDGLADSWENGHFGSTAGQSALDDTDGDGAVELLEFAFGTDPRAPHSVPVPAVVVLGGYLTTTITKKPGVRYVVETGPTLDVGLSASNTTVLTEDANTLKVRDNVRIGDEPERFLRVQVTAAP